MIWQRSKKKWRKWRNRGKMKVILETAKRKRDIAKKKKAMNMEGRLEKSEQNE